MLQYFRSTSRQLDITSQDALKVGTWIRSEKPNDAERQVLMNLGIDEDILLDTLDPHEVPRVEAGDGWTYFITRLPDTADESVGKRRYRAGYIKSAYLVDSILLPSAIAVV